jgi:hypothetical protein
LIRLVEAAGGLVSEGLFVERPGIMLLAATALTPRSAELFEVMNIDIDRPEYEQLAEFNSRVTYLSFPDERSSGAADFNRRMVKEYGHLSVHSATTATFLIAGVSVETSLELVAHSEAKVARLTSSRTRAMDQTLYRVQGAESDREAQRSLVKEAVAQRTRWLAANPAPDLDGREWRNRLNLGAKATALTFTMSIKDFHKTFIGRLSPHGVEAEVAEVCKAMCRALHLRYPLVIEPPEAYFALNNSAKYSLE